MLKIKLNHKQLLFIILVFAFILRFFRLDYPNKYVFDEVYHAFTAREYLKGSKQAWEWWNTPPPGVAYEWTHPPLAKEIMTVSMYINHTENGWAWRLPGALLGVLSVFLIYKLGIILLKKQSAALISSFIFSIDGLNFVQSRVGMNDIYLVSFMLISLFFFLKKKFFWSAVFIGLAFASKWTAIYLLIMYFIMAIYFFKQKRKLFLKETLYFVILPPIIYLLSYLPFFLLGHSLNQFIELQKQMWWYHTGLKATHGYSSPWWSWPLNLYPIWYFVDYQKGAVANIFSSGNPAFFWIGSIALLLTVGEALKRKLINLKIILLGFFIFWLPWSLSPRIMFLYHFSPSVPFLALALGHQLSKGLDDKKTFRLVVSLLILITLSFFLIYPFLIGIPIPNKMLNLFFLTNLSKNPFN